jgi:hypothetical protein
MMQTVLAGEVVRKYIDDSFDAYTPVMVLRWADNPGQADRLWELPEGMCIVGGGPLLFGIRIRRQSPDTYAVRLLWETTQMRWAALSRVALLGSCLAPLLGALGIDLWSLLEQPLPGTRIRQRAA